MPDAIDDVPDALADGQRFSIRRRIGAGGMGIVYEAYDRERGTVVALKSLRKLDAGSLYRFKREFRALADLVHPNLVSLYELISIGDEWFFTMELLAGVGFLRYVQIAPEPEPVLAGDEPSTTADLGVAGTPRSVPLRPRPSLPRHASDTVNLTRLRSALGQLVTGVSALHQAGRLHRDLKPSNVLVTSAGRVVICDFGLVTEIEPQHAFITGQDHVIGTAAYMSPEQAGGQALSPASDWYSVGVMIHEALTGRVPFAGSAKDILMAKQLREPPPPGALVPGVPDDLNELVVDLLRVRPNLRPSGQEIKLRLGLGEPESPSPPPITSVAPPFVGREQALGALGDAFRISRSGRAALVLVQGSSGIGKTALLRQFLERMVAAGEAVVVQGRCYERESVPYKALDSLIDALTTFLSRLDPAEVGALLPEGIGALARLFPVLRRVHAVPEPLPRALDAADPQQVRARAFTALRELLGRMAVRKPVVLAIDDVQWGDLDSAVLLTSLLRPAQPPPILLVVCCRSEEAAESPFMRALMALGEGTGTGCEIRTLALEALPREGARELAAALLEREDPLTAERADLIAKESGGNPFFVHELARSMGAGAPPGRVSLQEVLRARIERLPVPERQVVRLIAVAGRPVTPEVLAHAADLDAAPTAAALSVLRAERLIRSGGSPKRDQLEPFHDRIREAVLGVLTPAELTLLHRRLAEALRSVPETDPRALVEHWLAAHELERAAPYAELAAVQAMEALAFDRAAQLYRLALDIQPLEPARASRLRALLGDALANAGRGADAAQAYLSAVPGAAAAQALELRRRAAEQLLRSGHIDEGLAAISNVLAAVGMSLAKTPNRALLSALVRRLRLRLRGLRYRPRDESQIPAEVLTRIDICWSVANGLSMADHVRGSDFQTRHLLLALQAGEPYRIARGLAMEVAYVSTTGAGSRHRVVGLLEPAERLARELGHPHTLGLTVLAKGAAALLRGSWRKARLYCQQGEAILRDRCPGVAWELAMAHQFEVLALTYLGEIRELSGLVPGRLREAEERGDRFSVAGLRGGRTCLIWLAADDVEQARREALAAERSWTRRGFHLQHCYELLAQGEIDLYTGCPARALERLEQRWRALERSLLLRIQPVRIEAWFMRGRCAVATSAARSGDHGLLAQARRDVRRIGRERVAWAQPVARLLSGAAELVSGAPERAAGHFQAAAGGFDGVDMALHAAVARHALGRILGGDRGRELRAAADAWMAGQGVRKPELLCAVLAPGLDALA